ncbi:hypothetical protein A2738_03585 [Candidatus Nomurabacteria bacterium RIFCSPHIGHO2_01_FULL_42_15]|uniref:Type II secretion system protein GspI C-terminal domain-containing protein n=1 Tax=Candidatus Nomurabacteria bacterium RIFCSPHIGHO2_01_FULL_42_15 TaxID=1801742 RepID=A0A1F6VE66_9BACT|nr:MAG: hypothetical protein A2738_03585 [Candidatus Nomurabacteria bacterium RIFCSPHIGHO2_01_FULL_42_15]OGI93286.1 MAG: hypothetical protein A3A99_03440 [Candidatus Nomurabacteria bacterium RIFCSPLOWO2_01_FULL_41_18]
MKKISYKNKKNHGYTLLELLFYISFFSMLSLVTINAMVIMTKSLREASIQAEFLQSGSVMERISREIRQAYEIDATSTETDLKLKTKDSAGTDKTIEFKFVSPNIQLWEAGSNSGNLNPPNISVTGLNFTQISTTNGEAVKVVLSVRSNNDSAAREQYFYNTIGLRGSY